MANPPFLLADNISFVYPSSPGRMVIDDLSLQIEAGEYVAVIGANGSGKTTLARLMNGLLKPTRGSMLVKGIDTRKPRQEQAVHAALGMVFQFPEDQVIATTVEEDVAFGLENLGIPSAEIRQRVEDALKKVNLWEQRQRSPHLLSAGQVQRLALAGVLAMQPGGIVFDEATTMIDPQGRKTLMDLLEQLNREGLTIVLITHHMEEAARAGRVVVLQNGRVALDGPPGAVFARPDVLKKCGLLQPTIFRIADILHQAIPALPAGILNPAQLVNAIPPYPGTPHRIPLLRVSPPHPSGDPIISVRDLVFRYQLGSPLERLALDGITFSIQPASSLGLMGATGSGKSTLLQHLIGLLRPQSGSIQIGPWHLEDPKVTTKMVIQLAGMVFQNPESQFFEQYAGDEVAFGPRQQGLPHEERVKRVQWAMEMVGLDFNAFKDRPTFSLSGGERRKLALASTLALKPTLLLLDEPTAGLDPMSRLEILERFRKFQAEGMTLVVSSHNMEDIAALARETLVLADGRQHALGSTAEVFEDTASLQGAGMEPPVVVQVAAALRDKGWLLPAGILTFEELAGMLQGNRESAS